MSKVFYGQQDSASTPAPSPMRDVTVQLEDGSLETFKIDTRVGGERLPRVLEAAVRARTRMKAGTFKPDKGVEPPSMMPDSIGGGIANIAKGAANVGVGMARDFVQGAKMVNSSPMEALKLLPEIVQEPLRNASKAEDDVTNAVVKRDYLGAAKSAVKGIPVVGPMADKFGEDVASGHGGEGLGEVAVNATMLEQGAKSLGNAVMPKTVKPPANVAIRPQLAGNIIKALQKNPSLSPQIAGQLKKALEHVASSGTKPTKVNLPIVVGGARIPLAIEINSHILTHVKSFVKSAAGSAQEMMGLKMILSQAEDSQDSEGDRRNPKNRAAARNIIGFDD